MTSPMELSRTISIRSTSGEDGPPSFIAGRLLSRHARPDNLSHRVVLWIAHNHHPSADFGHGIALRNRIDRIVRAFGLHVRTELTNQPPHIFFRKDDN